MTTLGTHEKAGLRISGNTYIRRTNVANQPVIGPLAATYFGVSPKMDRKTFMDTRPGLRGVPFAVITDPAEPEGQLTLLSMPRKALAMLMLGSVGALAQGAGSVTTEEHAFEADYGIQLAYENVGSVIVYPGVKATKATGVEGNNNAITWTAVRPGTDGNSITVALIDPTGNNVALSVAVDGTDIVVTCATDGASAITSTAAQIMAAIAASEAAAALVTVASTGASTGAGVVVAVSEGALSGGTKTGTPWTVGTDYEILSTREGIVRPLTDGGMGAAGWCFVSYTYGTVGGTRVTMGGDAVVEVEVRIEGTNDVQGDDGETSSPVRMIARRMLLTPKGTLNLIGTDLVQADFDALPLTPASGNAMDIDYPAYGLPS
jgi:hypothetical protein